MLQSCTAEARAEPTQHHSVEFISTMRQHTWWSYPSWANQHNINDMLELCCEEDKQINWAPQNMMSTQNLTILTSKHMDLMATNTYLWFIVSHTRIHDCDGVTPTNLRSSAPASSYKWRSCTTVVRTQFVTFLCRSVYILTCSRRQENNNLN